MNAITRELGVKTAQDHFRNLKIQEQRRRAARTLPEIHRQLQADSAGEPVTFSGEALYPRELGGE